MPTYLTTAKHALRRLTGSNVIADIDAGFQALAEDLDGIIATDGQGVLAARPVSTGGSPGKVGRWFKATDTGQVFRDYGTGWDEISTPVEAVHAVGAGGEPAFENGWATPGGANPVPAFYKDRGRVYLQGYATRAAGASTASIFTLPVGYRPAGPGAFPNSGDGSTPRVLLVSAGGVVSSAFNTELVNMDGVSFRVA